MSIKNNFPNVRPSLTVDFRNSETVDPRIVSSRASTATYTDKFGRVVSEDPDPLLPFSIDPQPYPIRIWA